MLANCFITVINYILKGLAYIIKGFMGLLPDSPFKYLISISKKYIEYLNYIIPVGLIVSTLEVWLIAVSCYYVYSIILRWTKSIE